MRKYLLTAALVAAAVPLSPALAREMSGFVVRSTVMRAGPDYDYPAVQRLRRDAGVTVHGCLRDWNWCDVSNRYDRGWIARQDIVVNYQGRRRGITAYLGIGILSFSFGNYWDSYYRSRPFYSQRSRWEQHYNGGGYRPSGNTRASTPVATPKQRQPGMGGNRGGKPLDQAAPGRRSAPSAPQVDSQQRRHGAVQRQSAPAQQQAAPQARGNQNRQATPNGGNTGQRQAPGNQHGGQGGDQGGGTGNGQGGHSQDNANKDHKSRD